MAVDGSLTATIYVAVTDTLVVALDALTGFPLRQFGHTSGYALANRLPSACFTSTNCGSRYGIIDSGDTVLLPEGIALRSLAALSYPVTAIDVGALTGAVYSTTFDMVARKIGTGSQVDCLNYSVSASVQRGTSWSWPEGADQRYEPSPFRLGKTVTGWHSIGEALDAPDTIGSCGGVESSNGEYYRSCRPASTNGIDATAAATCAVSNGASDDRMPLHNFAPGITSIVAATHTVNLEVNFCEMEVSVTEVSCREASCREKVSVAKGVQTSLNLTFDDYLAGHTGTGVMQAADWSNSSSMFRLLNLSLVNMTLGLEHVVGNSNLVRSISISGIFKDAVVLEGLALSDRGEQGGPSAYFSATVPVTVLLAPLAVGCPSSMIVDVNGDKVSFDVQLPGGEDSVRTLRFVNRTLEIEIGQEHADLLHHHMEERFRVEAQNGSLYPVFTIVEDVPPSSPSLVMAVWEDRGETSADLLLSSCSVPVYLVNISLFQPSITVEPGPTALDVDIVILFNDVGHPSNQDARLLGTGLFFQTEGAVNSSISVRFAESKRTQIGGLGASTGDNQTGTQRVLQISAEAAELRASGSHTVRLVYSFDITNHNASEFRYLVGGANFRLNIKECSDSFTCAGHGVCEDEGDPFDGQYTCVCSQGWSGVDCGIEDAVKAAKASEDDTAVTVGVSLGAVLLVILAAFVATRIQLYRVKHRPVNLDAMRDEVMAGLGLMRNDIGDHEFGVTLTLTADVDPADVASFKSELILAIHKTIPKCNLEHARVAVAETRHAQVLLVIPRPAGRSKMSDFAERTVASLKARAGKQAIAVRANSITDASLAMPTTIPREMDRGTLTRLELLGKGAFGEVCLYQVTERQHTRTVPAYSVAVKTARSGANVGREELLKEATLMALLDHRFVLKLIGVVTAPRNLPVLIVLEFCEGGELLQRVQSAAPEELSVTNMLTYGAQIALGMQYIATRNIVHRDLAARNVLLSIDRTCKVADFGMSASLVQAGKQYAAEYVRMREEVAMRWASPEALQDQKFSAASDVWSYGVVLWEIFSAGKLPFEDLGIGEIGAFVRTGGKLGAPPPSDCPPEVYEQLILPCFAFDAKKRPAFGELYDVAVAHGAIEDEETLEEYACMRRRPSFQLGRTVQVDNPDDRSLLAPSVHHLGGVVLSDLHAAVAATVEKNLSGSVDPEDLFPLLDAQEASSYHVKDFLVLPQTKSVVCLRDGQLGAIFVDTLEGADNVGNATAILSYAWKYGLALIAGALNDWCATEGRDPKRQYIWLDVLCWNQHGRLADPVGEWCPRVERIGHQLTMLYPWNEPVYTTRGWCVFELWYAIQLGKKVSLSIILTPSCRAAFNLAINQEGYGVVDRALQNIHAESAEAYSADDLTKIKTKVMSLAGGWNSLNETIRSHLGRWFQAHGGVRVAAADRGWRTGSSGNSRDHSGNGSSGSYPGNSHPGNRLGTSSPPLPAPGPGPLQLHPAVEVANPAFVGFVDGVDVATSEEEQSRDAFGFPGGLYV